MEQKIQYNLRIFSIFFECTFLTHLNITMDAHFIFNTCCLSSLNVVELKIQYSLRIFSIFLECTFLIHVSITMDAHVLFEFSQHSVQLRTHVTSTLEDMHDA